MPPITTKVILLAVRFTVAQSNFHEHAAIYISHPLTALRSATYMLSQELYIHHVIFIIELQYRAILPVPFRATVTMPRVVPAKKSWSHWWIKSCEVYKEEHILWTITVYVNAFCHRMMWWNWLSSIAPTSLIINALNTSEPEQTWRLVGQTTFTENPIF